MKKKHIPWVLLSVLLFIPIYSSYGLLYKNGSRSFEGRTVEISEVPFIVLVIPGSQATCTGFIVARKWVISAAHCFSQTTEDAIIAYSTNDRGSWSSKIAAELVIVHPKYLLEYEEYDIALIKLRYNIPITETSKIISIETKSWPENLLRRLCYTAGYGHHISINKTGVLHGGQVTVGSGPYPYECQFLIYNIGKYLWTNRNESESICFGDSGCPLVCGRVAVGVGVVSYPCSQTSYSDGTGCGADSIDGFVPLYKNLNWLKSYVHCLPSSCSNSISLFTSTRYPDFLLITLTISLIVLAKDN